MMLNCLNGVSHRIRSVFICLYLWEKKTHWERGREKEANLILSIIIFFPLFSYKIYLPLFFSPWMLKYLSRFYYIQCYCSIVIRLRCLSMHCIFDLSFSRRIWNEDIINKRHRKCWSVDNSMMIHMYMLSVRMVETFFESVRIDWISKVSCFLLFSVSSYQTCFFLNLPDITSWWSKHSLW